VLERPGTCTDCYNLTTATSAEDFPENNNEEVEEENSYDNEENFN